MLRPYIYIACLSLFFFLVLPGAGAFYVRGQWRQFRKNILESTLRPFVSYSEVHGSRKGYIGAFRFIGTLEALEENSVWIKNNRLTVGAFMDKCQVYLLPSQDIVEKEGLFENNIETLPEESPQRISWRSIFTLPEGTMVFITGALFREGGRTVFKACREHPLMMVIFDGSEETLLRRSIWGGRQKNEYLNQFTFPSIIVGFFSLLIYAYLLYRNDIMMKQPFVTALAAGLLPLAGFLPPGLFGLFLYRSFWRRARVLRAERDLLLLPVWPFARNRDAAGGVYGPELLPEGNSYYFTAAETTMEAALKKCTGDIKVRVPSLINRPSRSEVHRYYLFGIPVPAGERLLYLPPADPMGEYILVPGNPEELSKKCGASARRFEYIAVSAFIAGLGINVLMIFWLLYTIIR